MVYARNRWVPTDAATINNLLDLPNNVDEILKLAAVFEDQHYDFIHDHLCILGTEWNQDRIPNTVPRTHLRPEAKLSITFIKCNIMPVSHNQTVDRQYLMLIHAILTGIKFNVRQVIEKELSEAYKTNRAILTFPCLISALCREAEVPSRPVDKYTQF
ncbi:hypothetical protein GQ457_01G016560 [Hibiscus cannabinus]